MKRLVRFSISGGRLPENELSCKNTERRSTHLESDEGIVPLKKFERRLNFRSMRNSERRSATPRQSQGAAGDEGSQPACYSAFNEALLKSVMFWWDL
ncbi:hypothetical protein Lal_00007261 [Lupinus albus]|nr:hypothetical protein Lal_00007261 [Lupinus albus]